MGWWCLNKMMGILQSFLRCFWCRLTVAFRSSHEMLAYQRLCSKASFPTVGEQLGWPSGKRGSRFQEVDMKPVGGKGAVIDDFRKQVRRVCRGIKKKVKMAAVALQLKLLPFLCVLWGLQWHGYGHHLGFRIHSFWGHPWTRRKCEAMAKWRNYQVPRQKPAWKWCGACRIRCKQGCGIFCYYLRIW